MSTQTYHIISISARRFVGDRAYRIRESFGASTLQEACARHVAAFRRPGSIVLRDGLTGRRYSVEESSRIAKASA